MEISLFGRQALEGAIYLIVRSASWSTMELNLTPVFYMQVISVYQIGLVSCGGSKFKIATVDHVVH